MEGLRESQRAQQEAGSTVIDLPTPIITDQVDRFLQVRAYATPTRQAYARRTTMCFGCSLNGLTPLRLYQPGAHRYLDTRPSLSRHQQGPGGGALHPAHRAHPDGPRCQPHPRLLGLHLLVLQARGFLEPLPTCFCGMLRGVFFNDLSPTLRGLPQRTARRRLLSSLVAERGQEPGLGLHY